MSMPVPFYHGEAGGSMIWRPAVRMRGKRAWLFFFLMCFVRTAAAQLGLKNLPDFSKNPEWFPRVYKPYIAQKVPRVELAN